ncbi:PREDICTED: uncharacterized protein LOC107338306 [Acropora digitifera]|uniref:uncharacterized protein LOC107338306 n=1 Tax=Acropora digitifera TaxID=70779 RepID=UPI00077A556F|nr:PREDICTED: uncharacterized protein LOC107338306 [Acropora digitifera]
MPPDARRWSSPEVNMDGYFSHASDVWAFGILAWELYQSFQHGENSPHLSIPYFWLDNDQILEHQRVSCLLDRPECCPDWVYILIHQCWTFRSDQRPPFLAIFDCLVSREPMNSWIMRHWLKTHKKEEYPDLCIRQENDAFHVLPESRHPPEESIRKMCSSDFFSQHKYKYVEKSIEEFGNPPASPPYEEPVRDHSQDCVAKVASSNEDLGYACPLDERMRSLGHENATLNPPYKKTTTLSGTENQNLDYAQQNANMNETYDYAEVTVFRYHSGIGHNKSGAHIAAIGFKDKNNKKEGSENGTYPSLSIHNEKQTDIPMEAKYQCPRENRGNPVGLEEKGETQSYQSETEFQEQEGNEEEIYGPIAPSADTNENAILEEVNDSIPMNPENEGKTARPGEICNQKQSGSQEEDERMAYSLEDDSGASTEDTLETLSTEEMKEDDHGAQSPLPTGEVPHQPSPFRRRRTIWRKRKSPETKKQRARKAKNLENKENAAPGCGSETEIVREQVPKEVNKQDRIEKQNIPNEISLCLLQRARMERHISTWDKQFSEIEMNLDI